MSAKPIIKCNCGQRIIAKDVLQTGQYIRLFGPSFVYVKFRCSRCKRLGEQFIEQDQWNAGILKDVPTEQTPEERKHFEQLGPIEIEEQINFHFLLERTKTLKESLRESAPPEKDERTD